MDCQPRGRHAAQRPADEHEARGVPEAVTCELHRAQKICASGVVGTRVPIGHNHGQSVPGHPFGQRPHGGPRIGLRAMPHQNSLLCSVTEDVGEAAGGVLDYVHRGWDAPHTRHATLRVNFVVRSVR